MKKYLAFETQDGEFDVEEGRMDAFREKYPEARQIRAFDTPDGEFDVTPERMDAFRAKYPEAKELFHYEDDSGEEWDVGEDRVQAFAEAQPSLMMQPAEAAARRDAAAARAARAHDREVLRENAAAMADVERARSASRQQAVDDREAVARGKENQAAAEAARSRSRSEFIRKREWDRSAVGKTVGVLGAAGKGAVDAAAEVLTQIPRGIGKGMQSAAEREANPAGAPMTYGEVREKAKLPFDEKMHKPTDPLTDQDLRALQTAAPGLYDEAMARLRNQTVGAERADAERKAARGRAVEEKFTLTEPWNPKEHSKAENFAHGFAGGAAKMPYYAATGGLGMYAEGIDRGESPVDAAGEAAVWGAPLLRWLRVRPGNATGGALAHAAEAAAKSAGSAAVAGRDVSAAETLGAAAMGAVIGGVGGHAAGKAERQANAAGKATGVWVDAKGPDGRPIVGGDGKPIQVNLGRAEEAVRNAQQAVEEMGVGMKDANGNRIRVTKDFIQGKGPQPTERGQYLRDLNRRPWAMVPEGILRGVPPRERIGTTAMQPGRTGAEAPRFEPRELEAPRPGLPLEQGRLGLDPEQGGVPHLYGTRVHPMQNKEPGSYVLPMDGPEGPSATRELQGILLGQKPDGATDAEWKAATGRAFVEAYGRRRGELSLDEKIEAVGTLEGSKPDAETAAWIKEEKTRILDETIAAPVYSEEQAVLRRLAELEKLSPAERNRRTSVEAFHAAWLSEGMDANHMDSLLTWGHDSSTGRFGIFSRPTDKSDPLYDWMRRNEKDNTVSRVVFGSKHSTGNDVLAREIAQAMPQYGFDPDDPYIAEKIADRLMQEYQEYQAWKERGAPTTEREIQDRQEIDHYAGREREPAEVDSEIVRGHVDADPENRASQEAEAWRETDPEALEAWEETVPYAAKNPDGTVNVPVRSLRTYGGSGMKPSGSAESGEVTAVENADGTLTVIGGNASAGAAGPDATVPVRIVGKDTGTALGNSRYLLKPSENGADPDGKLRTHGLDGLSGEAAREKAYEQAKENFPILRDIVNNAVSRSDGNASFRKELKNPKRVDEKTTNDYGGDYARVVDIDGGTVSLPDDASFVDAIEQIESEANRVGASIAKVKPFNMGPDATGYQDIKVSIRFQNGGIGEVIVASDYMLDAKNNRGGHKIYEVQRVLDGILENDKEGRIKLSQEEKDQIANVRDILAGFTVVLYSRGESARERLASVSWDRMKSMASSSVQDLLPMLGRRSIISSKDIKEVKSLADEFHLAKPPSVDSYAMPSRSFIQNDIVNNPLSNGEYTQPGNGVKGNPQGEGAIPSAEDAMASYDPQTREIFEADYSEDPAQLDAEEFRLTSGPVQTMFDFTPKDAAAFPVRPTENKAKAMELRREESELLRRIRKNVGGLLALNISKDFKEWGGTSLVGKRVTSPRDLAAVSQMLRSPLFETFYIVFTKGGQVVYSTAHTSRMAGISAGPTPNEMQDIFARFRDMGADRWYVMHNHPSGDVTASGPDEKLTDYLTAKYGGQGSFGGHIILDHTKFGLISYDASGKRSFKKMPIGNTDGLENQYRVGDSAILPDPTLGKDLRGEANTVNVLREIVRTVPIKKDRIVMVGSDSQWHVKSISAVPPGLLEKTWKNAIFEISRFEYRHPLGQGATPSDTPRKMYDLIRNYSSNTGSRYLFLANVPEKYVNAVRGAIDYGVVFTAVDQKGNIIHGHGNARGETLEDTLHFDEISKNLWKNGLDGGSFLAEPTTEFRSSRSTASAMRPIDPATGKLAVWNADAEYAEANAIRAEIDAAAASGTPPADPAAIVARTQAAAEALRAKHEYAGANKLLAYAGLPTAPSPLLDPVAAGARTEAQVRAGLTPQANIVYSEIVELLRKWGGGRIPVQADRWIRSAAGRIAPEVAGRITLAPGGAEKVQIRRQPYADGTNPFGLVGMAQEKSLRDLAQAEVAAAVTAGTIRLEDAPKALEENFRVKMENAARDNAAAGPGTATAILLHEFGHLVDSMPQSMMDRGNVLGHIGALYKYLKQGIGTNFGDTGPTEAAKKDYFQRRMKSWKASHPGVSDADARAAARRETNAWIESRGWARRADVANEIDGLLAWYHQSDGMPKYYEKPAEMYAEAFAAWMFWPLKARLLAPTFDRLMTEWGKAHGGAAWKAVEKLRNMGTIVDAAKNAAKDAASKEFFEDIRDRMRTNTAAWDAAMNLEDPEERLTLGEKLEWLKWALVGEAEPVRALARKAGGWGDQSAAAVLGSMNRYQHWEGVSRKELYGIRSKVLPIVADAGLNLSDLDMFLWARRVATEILGIEAKGGRMNLANWGGVIPGDVRTKYGNAPTSAAAYLHTLQDADPAKFDALERAAEEFRKVREDTVLAEMRESGAFGAEALAALAGNETYVRFMNLTGGGDQVDLRAVGRENVLSTWTGIHRQGPGSGTHEVGVSPTLATVIGDKEIIRRCRLNRARMELGKFLIDNFPDKTMQPLVAWKDGHRQIVQRASAAGSGRRWKTLVWMEDGHERGVEIPEQYLRALEGTYRGDDPATQLVQKAAAMANASLGFMTNFSYVFNPRNWWKDKENIIRLMPAPDRSNWIQRNVGRIDAAWNIVKGPDFAAMLRDGRYNETLYRFMDILPRGIQSSWAARKQPVLAEIMRALGDGTQVDETALGNVLTTMGLGDAFKRQMRREMSVVGKMTDAFAKAFWLSQAPNRFWQKGEVNNKIAVRAMLEREHPGWNPDRLDEIAEKRVGTPDPTDQPGWFQHNPLANSLLAFWNMNIHGLVDQFLGAVRDDPKTFGKRYAMWGLGKALRNHGGKLMVAAALPIAAWATDQLRKLERDGKGESVEADMLRGIVKAKDKIVEDAILMEQIPSYDKFAGTIVMPKWLDKDRKVVAYGMIPTDPTFIVTDVALAAAFDSLGASLLGMEPGAPLTEIPANATGSVSGSAGPMLRLLVATVGGVDPGRQWKSIYRDGDAQGPLSREYLETVYNIMTASTLGLYRAGSSERAPGDEPTTPVEEYYPFVKAILPFVKVSNGGSKEIGARIREEGKRRSRRKQETVRTVLQGKEASERDAAEWLMGTKDANADVKRAAIEAEKRRTMSPAERAAEDQPVKLREDVERRYLLERQPGIRGDEWD